MRYLIFSLMVFLQLNLLQAQPKLVVAIIVDQMRYNYLSRFGNEFGKGGFNRFLTDGYVYHNHHYNYVPTSTAPGHASIFTGSVPAVHGIADNDWFDRRTGKRRYCAEDSTIKPVGTNDSRSSRSPAMLNSTTIGDQLRIRNSKSKVVTVALKDRAAIFPGGYKANGAYWFDGTSGNFVSSSYYMKDLPAWVNDFNKKNLSAKYLKSTWVPLLPDSVYQEQDDQQYESKLRGENKNVFPYDLTKISKVYGPDLINRVPGGNTITVDFALAALEAEHLGEDQYTDLLSVSFSTPDIVGHTSGPHSKELHDIYLRLDIEISRLFEILEKKYGMENVLVFLTADHGVSDMPGIVNTNAGIYSEEEIAEKLKEFYQQQYNSKNLLLDVYNMQIYLNAEEFSEIKATREEVYNATRQFLLKTAGILDIVDVARPSDCRLPDKICTSIKNGIFRERSGDLVIITHPGWLEDVNRHSGSSHSTPYEYDTHVPLLWLGWKVKKGQSFHKSEVTDIAPTLAHLLNCLPPTGSTGNLLEDLLENIYR